MLFTFPSRYCALSVISSYLALEGGPPVFRQDFTCPALLSDGRTFPSTYRAVTCCGGAFHPASVDIHATEPVWAPPLSLTTTQGISVDFFSSGYLDVSVPRVPHVTLWIHGTFHDSSSWGFPHSEIHGSKLICSSPWLIAACHVLLRLLMPRHSPCALYSLTNRKQQLLFSFVNYAGFTDS